MRRLRVGVLAGVPALIAVACGTTHGVTGATSTAGGQATSSGTQGSVGSSSAASTGGTSATLSASSTSVAAVDAGPIVAPQPLSPNIVVDQFGYRTVAEKIAVVRSPQKGFDSAAPFAPGAKYAL